MGILRSVLYISCTILLLHWRIVKFFVGLFRYVEAWKRRDGRLPGGGGDFIVLLDMDYLRVAVPYIFFKIDYN